MVSRPQIDNDEQAVAADADAEHDVLPLQPARQLHEDLARSHDVVDRGDRHEHEADGEQHLVEMRLAIDMHIQRALEDQSDQRAEQEGERQGREKRHAQPVDQDDGAIAAGHGEGAMRQIDEIHQPERHREPACQHEQQHAVGDTVEQNGQHRLRVAPSDLAPEKRGARLCPQNVIINDARRPEAAARRIAAVYFFAAFTGSFTASKVANSTL